MTKGIDSAHPAAATHAVSVDASSERELAVTRLFDAPRQVVYRAWSEPDLFRRWWVPKSIGMQLLSCEMDVRTGGSYRLTFEHPSAPEPFSFFGTYTDVIPNERIAWTNDEDEGGALTTVTFADCDGATRVTVHELYPTRAARDEALQGSAAGLPEQFDQLDALLPSLARGG